MVSLDLQAYVTPNVLAMMHWSLCLCCDVQRGLASKNEGCVLASIVLILDIFVCI